MNFKPISIGMKITGSMIVLLSVMLLITVISFFKIEEINLTLEELTDYVIPISRSVNKIEVKVLKQQIVFEKIVGYLKSKTINRSLIDKEFSVFEAIEKDSETEINETVLLIEKGLEKVLVKSNIISLSKLEPLLNVVQNEHLKFYKLFLQVINDELDIVSAVPELEQLSDEYDKAIDKARYILQDTIHQESEEVLIGEMQTHEFFLVVSIITFFIGLFISPRISSGIVAPLKQIIVAAKNIGEGDLSVKIPVSSNDEVGQLSVSFNNMTKELIIKEEIKETFGKYVDPRIVEELLLKNSEFNISDGKKQNMTIFFSDIENFTSIAESLTPTALVLLMNSYFSLVSKPIAKHYGVIDKYIGDAVMAFWGDPFIGDKNHAKLACLAALEQFEEIDELNNNLADILGFRKNLPKISIRIGLCTGDVIAGSIGGSNSKSYTVMGDTVNIASRLESANKQFGTKILISESTYEMIKDDFIARKIDDIMVVGKSESVGVYELVGKNTNVTPQTLELIDLYEKAYALYQAREWDKACENLKKCLNNNEEDKASKVLLQRIDSFIKNPPPDDWNGVWSMTKK